jgi:hypothetical protein
MGAAYRNLQLITRPLPSSLIKSSSQLCLTPAHFWLFVRFAMQSNTRPLSPPPRLPSPQLLPTPLPSPPLHHQQSRPRLNISLSQPKPPSPLGQPAASGSPIRPQPNLHAPRAQPPPPLDLSLWLDSDDFGARRARSYSPPSPYSPAEGQAQHDHRRRPTPISMAHPRSRSRPRSPPPSPGRPLTPPPVPPIPTHLLSVSTSTGKPILQPRSTYLTPTDHRLNLPSHHSHPPLLRKARSTNAMTCISFPHRP